MSRRGPKAGNGEGSVFPREKQGKTVWIAQVTAGRKPNGKRRYITKQFPSQAAARRGLRALLADRDRGTLMPHSQHTVASYATYWVQQVKPLDVRSTTASGYEHLLARYVVPVIGHKRLADLRPVDVQGLMGQMRDGGYSVATVNQVRRILNGMCRHAARCGLLGTNPVAATDPMKRQSSDKTQVRQPWTKEEAKRAIEVFREHDQLDCFMHLMISLGLRPGEALGLRWVDVDFQLGQLVVSGTLKEGRLQMPDGTGVVRHLRNDPKTSSSHRTLPIPKGLFSALERQRLRQTTWQLLAGSAWQDSGYVITTRVGTPMWSSNVRKMFRDHCAKHGIRRIRLHDIRHVVARLALSHDIPLEQVSQALGHTRLDTTKQIYAGSVQRLNDQFVAGMSEVMSSDRCSNRRSEDALSSRNASSYDWGSAS